MAKILRVLLLARANDFGPTILLRNLYIRMLRSNQDTKKRIITCIKDKVNQKIHLSMETTVVSMISIKAVCHDES